MALTRIKTDQILDGTITGSDIASGTDISSNNLTLSGDLRGPATFTIDPAAIGDNTGTVVIAGDLQVDGETTTINSSTLTVDDKQIVIASGATDNTSADGAGILIDGVNAEITYDGTNDRFEINKDVNVSGGLDVDSGTLFVDSANNRVGVGTSSPGYALEVNSGALNNIAAFRSTDNGANLYLADNDSSVRIRVDNDGGGGRIGFEIGGDGNLSSTSEAARIDSDGNLLVGTTTINPSISATPGVNIFPFGVFNASRNNGQSLDLGRNNSDGEIVRFRKDGSTVGSIGVEFGDNFYLIGNSSHAGIGIGADNIYPSNGSSSTTDDGSTSLGSNGSRFKDLYLSGGIYLGGTGSANYLEDYEEGTFNPTIRGRTTAGSYNYESQRTGGRYRKIGDTVFFAGTIRVSSVSSSGSGNLQIGGLPFIGDNRVSQNGPSGFMHTFYDIDTHSGKSNIVGRLAPSGTKIEVFDITDGSYGTNVPQVTEYDTVNNFIHFAGSYTTDS